MQKKSDILLNKLSGFAGSVYCKFESVMGQMYIVG